MGYEILGPFEAYCFKRHASSQFKSRTNPLRAGRLGAQKFILENSLLEKSVKKLDAIVGAVPIDYGKLLDRGNILQ